MKGLQVTARVNPKLDALSDIVTQLPTMHPAETHNKQQFYMQICESPLEDRRRLETERLVPTEARTGGASVPDSAAGSADQGDSFAAILLVRTLPNA